MPQLENAISARRSPRVSRTSSGIKVEDHELSDTPSKSKKPQKQINTPTKVDKPQWQKNLDRFLEVIFLPQDLYLRKHLDTVPFRIITDPKFSGIFSGILQCFAQLLDLKLGHEEGTSASHLEATASMLSQAEELSLEFAEVAIPKEKHNKNLAPIITSATSLTKSFCFDYAAKPSSWSEESVIKHRQFCKQALDFAVTSLSFMEDTTNNEMKKGFGVGGARGKKRSLEDDEENESGNEAGSKRRRLASPTHSKTSIRR